MKLTKPPPESEAEFLAKILELARAFGWLVYHARPAMTSRMNKQGKAVWVTPLQGDPGFPDLIIARVLYKEQKERQFEPAEARLIIAEVKSEKGRLSNYQKAWFDFLIPCSHFIICKMSPVPEIYLWQPSDLAEIAKLLR